MTAMSNYLEDALLDHVLGTASLTQPSGVHAQLHTGDPGEDCTASVATETSRQAVSFSAAASKSITNDAATSWTTVAATEVYTHFSLWDASTGGNPLFYGAVTGGSVTAGDDFDIAVSGLTIDLSGTFTTFAANSALDHVCGNTAWTAPTVHAVKLHTGAPGDDATGSAATETTRVDAGAFSAAASGTADNDAAVSWSSVAGTETLSHFSVWDALTAGNPLLQGAFTVAKAVTAGQDVEIPAGDLDVTFE